VFCQQHGFDRMRRASILAQLDDMLQRIRRIQTEPTTLSVTRTEKDLLLDWTTSNVRLPLPEPKIASSSRDVGSSSQALPIISLHSRVRASGFRFCDEPALQVLHLERPHPRETMCGDMALVARHAGVVRLVVADGLGHGPAAREAAEVAIRWLKASQAESLEEAVLAAHEQAAATRGATLGMAELDLKTLTVSATTVGNVRVGIYQTTGRLWAPCGTDAVLGHGRGSFHGKLDVRVEKQQLTPGALLLLFSDGLASQLRLPFQRPQSLEELATTLFSNFSVPSDDATLLMLSTSR
jgi:hypothetical protein